MRTERRRYFRITDTIGLSFRVMDSQIPDLKLPAAITERYEVIEKLDTELDILLNSLWSSDPVYAKAVSLLNQKIEILFGETKPVDYELMERFDHHFPELEVCISAAGMAFTSEVKVKFHDRLEILMLLGPSKSKVTIKGTIVSVDEKEIDGQSVYFTCVDFDIEVQKREQLIQYIIQRQVEHIAQ